MRWSRATRILKGQQAVLVPRDNSVDGEPEWVGRYLTESQRHAAVVLGWLRVNCQVPGSRLSVEALAASAPLLKAALGNSSRSWEPVVMPSHVGRLRVTLANARDFDRLAEEVKYCPYDQLTELVARDTAADRDTAAHRYTAEVSVVGTGASGARPALTALHTSIEALGLSVGEPVVAAVVCCERPSSEISLGGRTLTAAGAPGAART